MSMVYVGIVSALKNPRHPGVRWSQPVGCLPLADQQQRRASDLATDRSEPGLAQESAIIPTVALVRELRVGVGLLVPDPSRLDGRGIKIGHRGIVNNFS